MLNPVIVYDELTDYHRLKSIEKGGRQAITTAAMNAMWEALEEGKGQEEVEQVYFSFFNKRHGKENVLQD